MKFTPGCKKIKRWSQHTSKGEKASGGLHFRVLGSDFENSTGIACRACWGLWVENNLNFQLQDFLRRAMSLRLWVEEGGVRLHGTLKMPKKPFDLVRQLKYVFKSGLLLQPTLPRMVSALTNWSFLTVFPHLPPRSVWYQKLPNIRTARTLCCPGVDCLMTHRGPS